MEQPQKTDLEEKPLNQDAQPYRDKSFSEKCRYVRENITVEPLLAGLIIPSVISRFAMGNLNLDKACRVNLQLNDTVCNALVQKSSSNFTEYERRVQELISSIDIWKGIIQTALPCLLIMFLGAWSDRTGKRKIIILLPIFGELLTCFNNLVNVYYFYEIPVEVTVFLETLFVSITGGWVTMFMGVFSYISDITDMESRTFRVGLVNFCLTAGLPIGMALSGLLIKVMGYYALFSTTSVMYILVLMYGTLRLMEPDALLKKRGMPPVQRPERDKDMSFFNMSHVMETTSVAFRQRPCNMRTKLLLSMLAVFILFGPTSSEHHVFYLFVRNQLNWDMVKFGLYISYSILLHSFGALFSISILSRRLQVDDSLLCLISIASKFSSSTWTAFVKTDLEMYIIPIVDILNATTFTSLRSIMSKIVDKQETAKVNSLFSLTETLAALVFSPLYSWLYMKTLYVLPGAVFLTSAAMTIPAAVILATFYNQHRKEVRGTRKKALEAEVRKEAEIKASLDINISTNENNENNTVNKMKL